MSRDWTYYLDDIHIACEKVIRYTKGLDQKFFISDEKTYDAVVRNLEIVGEASKQIPEEARNSMQDIEWKKAAGLRDVLAHAYFGIDNDILWDVIENKIPELLEAIEQFKNNPILNNKGEVI
ncbi:MAG: DUF86 domain-containing protein [Pseudomonadota bacterium]